MLRTMCEKVGVRRDLHPNPIAVAVHGDPLDPSHAGLRLALDRPERREVELADERLGGAVHGSGIERTRDPGAAQPLKGGARARIQDVVAVDAPHGTVPGMEVRRDLAGPLKRNGRRQAGVGPQYPGARSAHGSVSKWITCPTAWTPASVRPAQVALTGAPATKASARSTILETRRVRLGLPAGKFRSVVLHQRREATRGADDAQPGSDSIRREASCFWLAEPSCTTSSENAARTFRIAHVHIGACQIELGPDLAHGHGLELGQRHVDRFQLVGLGLNLLSGARRRERLAHVEIHPAAALTGLEHLGGEHFLGCPRLRHGIAGAEAVASRSRSRSMLSELMPRSLEVESMSTLSPS